MAMLEELEEGTARSTQGMRRPREGRSKHRGRGLRGGGLPGQVASADSAEAFWTMAVSGR